MVTHSDVPVNINGVLVLSLTGQWSPIIREDSWIVHSRAVASDDSGESAQGCSHSPTYISLQCSSMNRLKIRDGVSTVTADDIGS